MAQMDDGGGDADKAIITFQTTTAVEAEIDRALAEERRVLGLDERSRKRTKSKVAAFLVELGLDLYWARHELGPDTFKQLEGDARGDRRKVLSELLELGLEAKKKRRK